MEILGQISAEIDNRILVTTDEDLLHTSLEDRSKLFRYAAQVVDLILPDDAAEDAIGNLAEIYVRRLARDAGHAQRHLIAQVLWIVFGRAMDVLRQFTAARAGK